MFLREIPLFHGKANFFLIEIREYALTIDFAWTAADGFLKANGITTIKLDRSVRIKLINV